MDERFMTLLNAAFTTIASKSVHRDDVKHQIQMGEENLEKLRVELVKSEQDLQSIIDVVANLRRVFEFPGDHGEDWESTGDHGEGLGDDGIAQVSDKLLRFIGTAPGLRRSKSRSSSLTTNSCRSG